MNWSDIPWTPSTRTLRQFAVLWVVAFAGLAAWHGLAGSHPGLAAGCLVLAVTLGPLGLARPQALRPVFVAWMVAVFPVGWAVSRLVLALVFYGVFTPLALLFRLAGRDALGRRYEPAVATYWTPWPATPDVGLYFRSF